MVKKHEAVHKQETEMTDQYYEVNALVIKEFHIKVTFRHN